MKLLTLNCFLSPWSPTRKNRLPFIVKALTEEKPDIILLQELFFSTDANFIVQKLSEFGFSNSFYSKTLLIASRFPFLSQNFYEFPPHFSCHTLLYLIEIGNWIYGKGFQVVRISIDGQPVTFANLHLLSAYGQDSGAYREARLRQLREVCNHLEHMKVNPLILAGDFNFDIHSPSHAVVKRDYGFEDPFETVAGNTFGTDNFNRKSFWMKKMNQRIDHIFIKGFRQNQKNGQIIFRKPFHIAGKPFHISDHYGLALTIQ